MSYGKVINGGAPMRKGVSKGINDKLASFANEDARREKVAVAVRDAYKVNTVSSQHTDNSDKGRFTKPSNRSKNYAGV